MTDRALVALETSLFFISLLTGLYLKNQLINKAISCQHTSFAYYLRLYLNTYRKGNKLTTLLLASYTSSYVMPIFWAT